MSDEQTNEEQMNDDAGARERENEQPNKRAGEQPSDQPLHADTERWPGIDRPDLRVCSGCAHRWQVWPTGKSHSSVDQLFCPACPVCARVEERHAEEKTPLPGDRSAEQPPPPPSSDSSCFVRTNVDVSGERIDWCFAHSQRLRECAAASKRAIVQPQQPNQDAGGIPFMPEPAAAQQPERPIPPYDARYCNSTFADQRLDELADQWYPPVGIDRSAARMRTFSRVLAIGLSAIDLLERRPTEFVREQAKRAELATKIIEKEMSKRESERRDRAGAERAARMLEALTGVPVQLTDIKPFWTAEAEELRHADDDRRLAEAEIAAIKACREARRKNISKPGEHLPTCPALRWNEEAAQRAGEKDQSAAEQLAASGPAYQERIQEIAADPAFYRPADAPIHPRWCGCGPGQICGRCVGQSQGTVDPAFYRTSDPTMRMLYEREQAERDRQLREFKEWEARERVSAIKYDELEKAYAEATAESADGPNLASGGPRYVPERPSAEPSPSRFLFGCDDDCSCCSSESEFSAHLLPIAGGLALGGLLALIISSLFDRRPIR